MRGQRALVTGAAGFIGSALCRRLAHLGVEVHGVSRTARAAEDHIARWWQCDLEHFEAVSDLVSEARPDLVFHLASNSAGSRALELVVPLFHSNLQTTVNLLAATAEIGCNRILLAGSMEEPDPNQHWPIPSSPYAAAKFASGAYGRMFHALYNTPVVNLRVFMVYGPAQGETYKLIPYVTLSLLRGEVPKLSSGERVIDWIYVDDVVEGFLAAAVARNIEGATLDLGSGEQVNVHDVVGKLVDIINPAIQPAFGAVPERPMEQTRIARVEDSFRRLGWRAQTPLWEGLIRTTEWYRQHIQG